jgi:hypothetical protein
MEEQIGWFTVHGQIADLIDDEQAIAIVLRSANPLC